MANLRHGKIENNEAKNTARNVKISKRAVQTLETLRIATPRERVAALNVLDGCATLDDWTLVCSAIAKYSACHNADQPAIVEL